VRHLEQRSLNASQAPLRRRAWLVAILFAGVIAGSTTSEGAEKTIAEPRPFPKFTAIPPIANDALACTADRGDPQSTTGRDLDGYMYSDPGMTHDKCRSTCSSRGLVFAGTQYGSYCFCGTHFGRAGPSTNCNMSCSGAPGETCGGTWANSILLSGAEPAKPTPPGNGLQCFIGIRGSYQDPARKISYTYRQTEVQRWEVTGAPIPNGTGYILPVRWTSTGSGTLHEDDGKGHVVDSKWGISAMHQAALTQVRYGQGWKISRATTPPATALDNIIESRQETINGVAQPPAIVKATATEYKYGDIETYPLVSVQYDSRGVYNPYQGYRHPMSYTSVTVAGQCEGELHLGPP